MRKFFFRCIPVAILFSAWGIADAQGPGGGGRGGFGGGGGPDPSMIWGFISKGQTVLTRDSVDSRTLSMWDKFAPGTTTLTKDQFVTAFTKAMEERMANGGGFGGKGGGGGPGGSNGSDPDKQVEDRFRQMDKDGDGQLSFEEMNDRLKEVKDKYDTNKDGFISLEEYKVYYRDRLAERAAGQTQSPGSSKPDPNSKDAATAPGGLPLSPTTEPDEDARPKIQRIGKFSKELPEWFVMMDKNGDNDGQVGLYEWRQAGRPVAEFVTWDLNDDGYITPEEVLKVLKSGKSAIASNGPDGVPSTGFGGMPIPDAVMSGEMKQGMGSFPGRTGFGGSGGPGGFGGRSMSGGASDGSNPGRMGGGGPGGPGGGRMKGGGGPGGDNSGGGPRGNKGGSQQDDGSGSNGPRTKGSKGGNKGGGGGN